MARLKDQDRATAPAGGAREAPDLSPVSARALLLTVLGEFVWPTGTPVWTSSLLYVLKGLGVEEQTARQAISRAASSGWIQQQRHGRKVRWQLTEAGRRIFDEGSPRVRGMSNPFSDWDGTWLTILVTIPQSHRGARKRLYAGLTWAGFGNPMPGVWLSPHPERSAEVGALIDELDLRRHTLSIVGHTSGLGTDEEDLVAQGWDLETLGEQYASTLDDFTGVDPTPGDDMLFTYVRMISEWQRFPQRDPQLPEALLPDWIGRRTARHIESLRARWHDRVHTHWATINTAE